MGRKLAAVAAVAIFGTTAIAQQAAAPPGTADIARARAGTYVADPLHTQIMFAIQHLGFNDYFGLFGDVTGTLAIDPARPEAARLSVTVPIASVVTSSKLLDGRLLGPGFFDAAKYETATFRSTKVQVAGASAKVSGDFTLRGVTRPVVLDVRFTGAGVNAITKVETIGFEAVTSIKRSEFGMTNGVGPIADRVDLKITAAFERK